MLFFNHQLIWKHFYLRIYFIYNYSILNIELHIKKWNWGFNIGEIIDSSLLNSLLLSWDGILNRKISCQNVINIISPLFSQNMKSNPWYKKYIIIFEQSNEFNNMCILSSNVVDEIIKIIIGLTMDLKVCMLLMKYKIYHFYFTCIIIHNIT
jgi:hypothetical protein